MSTCFASSSAGYEIGCKQACDECLSRGAVCASDYGHYPSNCEASKSMCRMYGIEAVKNVTWASCNRKYKVKFGEEHLV